MAGKDGVLECFRANSVFDAIRQITQNGTAFVSHNHVVIREEVAEGLQKYIDFF